MKKLLISHSLLAQMMAISLNKKYDYVCHMRYVEKDCSNQDILSEINSKENERLILLEALGSDIDKYKIRDRELIQLQEVIVQKDLQELTYASLDTSEKNKENFKKIQNAIKIQKIIWLTMK